ncbi:MAG: homocysteine S-methyltransferase family protein [Humidesulfovibrio sp.]|uniref:homocysteine S-methyltransferase family protein n=1 Tax=Humidesulfovibrio sp. TaxID=2910988 RepID=UPI0027325440|nr:homocysteine S-methyltransferase family protein [Humidesulfovibrio sp.]MDP2846875.1 homocysteine S-methyltransferase family protein [Humidesulfovibrio sp.]
MPDFRSLLTDGRIHFFDGGFGALLQSRGLPPGVAPEMFGLKNPEPVAAIHAEYAAAGAEIVTTNTFGGTRFKLDPGMDVRGLNCALARTAKNAVQGRAFVAGSVGPTGHFVQPMGELSFRDMVAAYREQIQGLVDGGADLILGETQFDLAEAKAIVIAAREVCDLPVGITMTFEGAKSLTGTTPLTFIDTMQNLGVELLGTNCSAGPEQIVDIVKSMLPRLSTPLLVQPNAGLPELDETGKTVFRLGPDDFARQCRVFADLGAKFLGGCCGTTPKHITALREAVGETPYARPAPEDKSPLVLTCRSASVAFGWENPLQIIGERINPTGKKVLAEELVQNSHAEALRLATEQIAQGASILDVNVGAPMVDEKLVLPSLALALSSRFEVPLSLDTSDIVAMENALWTQPGSPLVNSISGEPGRMEQLGPLCKKFGAPFILLPLEGRKLPYTAAERIAVIERLLAQADELGIPRRLIMVDALVLTVSSKALAARHCLDTIRYCRETLGLPTTMGLSNVSFGLPARELLNSTFLALSMGAGLSSCIANPASQRLREVAASAEVLLARDAQASCYIGSYANWTPGAGGSGAAAGGAPGAGKAATPGEAVILGDKAGLLAMLETALAEGADPFALVDGQLIPAILEVGAKYERKEYFLPQLLRSAEAMQAGFGRLEPLLLASGRAEKKTPIVMATVEGDIHDIGKNIVCLMLKNHGFEVFDLGKDVPATQIVDEAERVGAKVIGLSALMTTTMVRMEDTVRLVRERGLDMKVMIGGAVVTEAFAQSIGADGFSRDAVAAVKMAAELSGRVAAH